jgi:hypothetical protein
VQEIESTPAERVLTLAGNIVIGGVRSFVLTPLMFFYLLLILFYIMIIMVLLRGGGVLSEGLFLSSMTRFANEMMNNFDLMTAIRYMISATFVFSVIVTIVRETRGKKAASLKKIIAISSGVIFLLWGILFVGTRGFAADNVGVAIGAVLAFTCIHLVLNLIYLGADHLLDILRIKLFPKST